MNPKVTSSPCLMHSPDRIGTTGQRPACGPVWYQATVEGHTIGACSRHRLDGRLGDVYEPIVEPVHVKVDTDKKSGQTTLTLTDKNGPVTAIGITTLPGRDG